jgi:hypothetical protein
MRDFTKSPTEKLATLRQVFGDTWELIEDSPELCRRRGEVLEMIEINTKPTTPYGIPPSSHAVLTLGFREKGPAKQSFSSRY